MIILTAREVEHIILDLERHAQAPGRTPPARRTTSSLAPECIAPSSHAAAIRAAVLRPTISK
jgi:hypothetical protein